ASAVIPERRGTRPFHASFNRSSTMRCPAAGTSPRSPTPSRRTRREGRRSRPGRSENWFGRSSPSAARCPDDSEDAVFVGHFALGFAAKRVAPTVPLWALLVATQFADLLWPVFVLTGIEHSHVAPGITRVTPLALDDIPWSHSLVTSVGWSALF